MVPSPNRVPECAVHALLAAGSVWMAGCFLSPLPDTRTPADFAQALERRCASVSDDSSEAMRAPAIVESVEPAYSFVSSASMDRQAILRGARVHLRPLPGLSRESLQRSLECHQAGVVLGKWHAPPNDPYTLPGEWLEVEAQSEGDGFVINVRAHARPQAELVLDRARRVYAARR
ncbi:MAG: hypothetical protein M3O36_13705 [Myxococcota bacterium]|nr:hypothetical protein [Myxococcota bacterium]